MAEIVTEDVDREIPFLRKLDITLDELCSGISQLDDHFRRSVEPPRHVPILLTPSQTYATDQVGDTYLSIGVRNNGNVPVYLSASGEVPRAGSGAIQIPAGSHVTIPTKVQDLVLGVDLADVPNMPVGGIKIDLYRYRTVQAANESFLPGAVTVYAAPGIGNAIEPGTSPAVGTASGELQAANEQRRYLLVTNPAGPGDVWLRLGSGAAVVGQGIWLPPGASWEMPTNAPYTGPVTAIATAAATNVSVVAY